MNEPAIVSVVDDDPAVRDSLSVLLGSAGYRTRAYGDAQSFLAAYTPGQVGCLVLDVQMAGMSGPELQVELLRRGADVPIVFLTAYGDVPTSVQAMKLGAVDFLVKPVIGVELLERIQIALTKSWHAQDEASRRFALQARLDGLTPREREVMAMVVLGWSSKVIARHLGISHRTVEIHRARVMQKTGAGNLTELARFGEVAGPSTASSS